MRRREQHIRSSSSRRSSSSSSSRRHCRSSSRSIERENSISHPLSHTHTTWPQAADEDPDISEALDELRSQLDESKRDKLGQLQALEQSERALATELGLSLQSKGSEPGDVPQSFDAQTRGGGGGMDASSLQFMQQMATTWKRLQDSSIEKARLPY